MNLNVAIILSLVFAAISAGVGIYLMRYRAAVTEMIGMMFGMTMGMMSGIAIGFYHRVRRPICSSATWSVSRLGWRLAPASAAGRADGRDGRQHGRVHGRA